MMMMTMTAKKYNMRSRWRSLRSPRSLPLVDTTSCKGDAAQKMLQQNVQTLRVDSFTKE